MVRTTWPPRATETSIHDFVTAKSSRASATTRGLADGVTASSEAGSMIDTAGAASAIDGISNAIRSVGRMPSAPTGLTSTTPRPSARQRTVQRDPSSGSMSTSNGTERPSPPSMWKVEADHADASSPTGGGGVPCILSSSVTDDPSSTGGESIARWSVPSPRSAVRGSTEPTRYSGGCTSTLADTTEGGGSSCTITGRVSMSGVRNTTSTPSPSASTRRSNEPSGCGESRMRRQPSDDPPSTRYSASTRMVDASPRTARARSGSAEPRGCTAERIAASTMVRAGHCTSANGRSKRRAPIEAKSGTNHDAVAIAVAASAAPARARHIGRTSSRRDVTPSATAAASWITCRSSAARSPAASPVAARSTPAASTPAAPGRPCSRRSATSTSGGQNRQAGHTRSTNHAAPPPRSAISSAARSKGGNRKTRSSSTPATAAATPNATAWATRSVSNARRILRRSRSTAAVTKDGGPCSFIMRASTIDGSPTPQPRAASP